VVLVPGGSVPFHLFEPRYRALCAAALEGDRVICVPLLVDPAAAPEPRAEVFPVAGAGVVTASERREDGTYDILLQVVGRVRLLEELERGAPYREFRAELLHDVYPAGGAASLAGAMEGLGQLVLDLAGLLPPESGATNLVEAVAKLRVPGAMADLVAAAAISEIRARQRVLETLDVAERLRLVTEEVASVVLMLSRGQGGPSN
jgi:Lon protease-like protein